MRTKLSGLLAALAVAQLLVACNDDPSTASDLATSVDAAVPIDLAVATDAARAPDLASVPDLVTAPDLAVADLAPPPDLRPPAPDDGGDARCAAAGATPGTALCCLATNDYPNQCLIGGCSCAPGSSHMVKICVCPQGKCFNGTTCQ